jgi:MSHA biogenesis protein MshO
MKINKHQSGFTLIEMVITIVIGGIVAAMATSILTTPIKAFVDSSRRATLTDTAESSLRRMQRDIRRALPNSIRVSADGQTLELLHLVDGGRYRAQLASDGSGDLLDFTTTDTSFDVLGSLQNFANVDSSNDSLVIYPLATTGNNAYAGDNRTALSGGSTATNLSFSAFQFPLASPQQRFFIVDTPISYHCDTSASATKDKVLMRYQDYAIQASQPTPPSSGAAIQVNHVNSCNFDYQSGSSTRSGLVTLELRLTDEVGESVHLIHQVHMSNQP